MTIRGVRQAPPVMRFELACGHAVLYVPPFPQANDELTCAACGAATWVVG
jgi:hypothetical protein